MRSHVAKGRSPGQGHRSHILYLLAKKYLLCQVWRKQIRSHMAKGEGHQVKGQGHTGKCKMYLLTGT